MKRPLILMLTLVPFLLSGQESVNTSVLAAGNWYQFKVAESGVYRINYDQMLEIGVMLNDVDPRLIKIYGNRGSMLPQPNDEARTQDLMENAIFIKGEDDGRFDKEDYLLFYGEGAGEIKFNVENQSIEVAPHLYDRFNYYYLTIAKKPGLRIEPEPNIPDEANTEITYFDDYIFHERSFKNLLTSGRKWYGEEMSEGEILSFELPIQNVIQEGKAQLKASVMSTSKKNSRFDFSLNDMKIGDINTEKVEFYAYGNQAQENEKVIEFDANLLMVNGNSNLEISFDDLSGALWYYLIFS